MIINNNKLNSLPEQVEENMKNIKLLASYIKEAYNTPLTLNSTDVSIAISDTNATTGTIEGWLLDSVGSLFKITGGDGTNLLIEYYTSFRGEQGVQGETGETGATGDRGFSIRFLTSGTISGINTFNKSDLISNTQITLNDLVIDGSGTIGYITYIGDTTITITEIQNIVTPQYFHPILLTKTGVFRIMIFIINNKSEAYNSTTLLNEILGFNGRLIANGAFLRSGDSRNYVAVDIEISGTNIYLNGFPATNGAYNQENIRLDTLWSSLDVCIDYVNQI